MKFYFCRKVISFNSGYLSNFDNNTCCKRVQSGLAGPKPLESVQQVVSQLMSVTSQSNNVLSISQYFTLLSYCRNLAITSANEDTRKQVHITKMIATHGELICMSESNTYWRNVVTHLTAELVREADWIQILFEMSVP